MKYNTLLSQSNFMVVNKKIAKKIGLLNAIVISNLCSLEDKYGNGFYFTQEDLAETCCVCLDTIKKSISYLKKNNFIKIEKKGLPCKNYYFFTTEFETFITSLLEEQSSSKMDDNNTNKLVDISTNKDGGNNTNIINNNINNKDNIKEDTNVSKKDENNSDIKSNIDELYKLYPSKCPKRNISLGKCFKDKERLKKLLKTHSFEMLKFTIEREISEKYNKSYMSNFSTFLNNLPDYGYEEHVLNNTQKEKASDRNGNLIIDGVVYK